MVGIILNNNFYFTLYRAVLFIVWCEWFDATAQDSSSQELTVQHYAQKQTNHDLIKLEDWGKT